MHPLNAFRLILLLQIFLFGLSSARAVTADTIVITDEVPRQLVGYNAKYYYDEGKQLTIEDVAAPQFGSRFHRHKYFVPEYSGHAGKVWIEITVQNASAQQLYIHFSNIYLGYIDVYFPDTLNAFNVRRTGYRRAYNTRDINLSNSYAVAIPESGTNLPYTFYASTETLGPHMLSMSIGTRRSLEKMFKVYEFAAAAVIGALAVMFFFNLCIYFVIRDKLYLYYLFYLLCALCYLLFFFGYFFEWLWPDNPEINGQTWPIGIAFISILLFGNKLLEVKRKLPAMHTVSYFIYTASFIICFSFVLGDLNTYMVHLVNITSIVLPIYLMAICVLLWHEKTYQPRLFMLGWMPFMLVMALFLILPRLNIFMQVVVDHGVSIAVVWEMSIFSLALGYRYNSVKQEKLEVQSENIRLIQEQNKMLEQRVMQRTEEITAQNEELMVQQQELTRSRRLLELEVLKTQVHPHFLFNTLNNLYGMITQNPSKGATLMVDLSDLMRHLIISSQYNSVLLKDEIWFIENYIALEKMRLTHAVEVTFNVNGEAGDKMVPPLLFLPFIENAFKHGLGPSISNPFISCTLVIESQKVMFMVENSRSPLVSDQESFGVSTTNLKRRLELLFPDEHMLSLEQGTGKFSAFLAFKVKQDYRN